MKALIGVEHIELISADIEGWFPIGADSMQFGTNSFIVKIPRFT